MGYGDMHLYEALRILGRAFEVLLNIDGLILCYRDYILRIDSESDCDCMTPRHSSCALFPFFSIFPFPQCHQKTPRIAPSTGQRGKPWHGLGEGLPTVAETAFSGANHFRPVRIHCRERAA